MEANGGPTPSQKDCLNFNSFLFTMRSMSMNTIIILIVAGSVALSLAVVGLVVWFLVRPILRNRRILRQGVPSEGKIISIQETHVYVNNKPQALIHLEVQSRQFGVYPAQTKKVLSPFEIPQYQPGAKVRLKIDPQDPQQVAIEAVMAQK